MVNNSKPDFNFLRVFECACWPYLRPYNKHKMDFRSKTCIFIGYSIGHRGYKCLDVSPLEKYMFPVMLFLTSLSFPMNHHKLLFLPFMKLLSFFLLISNYYILVPVFLQVLIFKLQHHFHRI